MLYAMMKWKIFIISKKYLRIKKVKVLKYVKNKKQYRMYIAFYQIYKTINRGEEKDFNQ